MSSIVDSPSGSAGASAVGRRPVRVLHFVSGGFSGATQIAIDLCSSRPGFENLLVLRRRSSIDPSARVAQLESAGLTVKVVPRWSHFATIAALARICRNWHPDVLVAHGFSEHLWGRYAGLLARVPRLIQVEHNTRERYSYWRLKQSLWLAKRTAHIVGVSQAVRDALVRKGHPPERCTVILNGIDLARWDSGLPWADREDAIVMPARFAAQKDHATLIRATALLAERGIHPTVYLAGGGKLHHRMPIQKLARELGVGSQVRFLGQVADMPGLFARVKLCVLSTHYEGFGLGVIEGMASGCCGIGTDVEGVREILNRDGIGFLVPHQDPGALAQLVARLLEDGTAAARVAAAGQRDVRARFSRDRMCREYADLFLR